MSAGFIYTDFSFGDYDSVAIYTVNKTDLEYMFQFETDVSNVYNLNDSSNSNINYYVKLPKNITGQGKSIFNLNPANAILTPSGEYNYFPRQKPPHTRSDYGPISSVGSQLVQDDFIKYLANELFNTPKAVEFFYNTSDMLQDISGQCTCDVSFNNTGNTYGGAVKINRVNGTANSVFKSIIGSIANVADTLDSNLVNGTFLPAPGGATPAQIDVSGFYFMTNSDKDKIQANLCLQLFNQLLQSQPQRFNNMQEFPNYGTYGPNVLEGSDSDRNADGNFARASIPFVVGDNISFTLTIRPYPGQGYLTGYNTAYGGNITERIYRIVLKLV